MSDDISVLEDCARNAVCLLQLTRTNRNLGVGTNYKDKCTNVQIGGQIHKHTLCRPQSSGGVHICYD